jgi:hypothetical protein
MAILSKSRPVNKIPATIAMAEMIMSSISVRLEVLSTSVAVVPPSLTTVFPQLRRKSAHENPAKYNACQEINREACGASMSTKMLMQTAIVSTMELTISRSFVVRIGL